MILEAFGHSFMGHSSGFGDVGRTMAHAAIWSVVGQFVRSIPLGLVVVVFIVAVAFLLVAGKRRRPAEAKMPASRYGKYPASWLWRKRGRL